MKERDAANGLLDVGDKLRALTAAERASISAGRDPQAAPSVTRSKRLVYSSTASSPRSRTDARIARTETLKASLR